MRQVVQGKVEEIVKWAKEYGNPMRYNRVMDLLCDKDETITQAELDEAWKVLEDRGVTILCENDEEYDAEETDSDTFVPAYVNIGQKPLNVYNLMERLLNNEIDLEPEFQRYGNLWPMDQQSRLIESMMLKIPIPAFYFNAADDEKWVVIDGLQRLTALQNFLVGREENGVRKKAEFVGLQYLKEFNGVTFDELPRQYVRRIKETPIVAYTVEKGTPDAVVYNIFQRINTGGLVLSPQEIRQALYTGKATRLAQQLAESEEFLQATQYAISPRRMVDREYVTRFIAFTELDYQQEYKGNIDNFLIMALKKVNNYEEKDLQRVAAGFKRVMGYSQAVFERYAFRKYNENWRRSPINKALFELWSVCFSELSDSQMDQVVDRREEFLLAFRSLQQIPEFITALKAGDRYSTVRRIDLARNLVRDFYDK